METRNQRILVLEYLNISKIFADLDLNSSVLRQKSISCMLSLQSKNTLYIEYPIFTVNHMS